MTNAPPPPFRRVDQIATPNLVGALWWQERISASANPVARRAALLALTGAVSLVAIGGGVAALVSNDEPDLAQSSRHSLDAQRELGWNVGAGNAGLSFEGATSEPFRASELDRLESALAPKSAALAPFYVSTLFQSLNALPTGTPIASDPMLRLRDAIRPISTPAMQRAHAAGASLASLFEGAPPGRAVIVDLLGPEAVAFAAGLAPALDVVFGFDGWPHPQGVVASHLTLAAAAHHMAELDTAKAARTANAPPAFVLDRGRLLPYSSDSDRFDNRYTAKLPTAQNLKTLGVTQLFYVGPGGSAEADDLNEDFIGYAQAGIEIRHLDPEDFSLGAAQALETTSARDDAATGGHYAGAPNRYYWGGSHRSHWFFWHHYGWGTPRYSAVRPANRYLRETYKPAPRATIFSGRSKPSTFGSVGLYRPSSGGRWIGTSRNGSWGRSGGSWGGA